MTWKKTSLIVLLLILGIVTSVAVVWWNPSFRLRDQGKLHPPAGRVQTHGVLSGGRGLYAGAIFDPRGRIKVPETIAHLKHMGINRYYYLIWDRRHPGEPGGTVMKPDLARNEWDALPDFAAQADKAGIDVVVYLVPPTESTAATYRPFGWDYEQWSSQIGRLARVHRNIVGIAIDDFGGNTDLRMNAGKLRFTPMYVDRCREAARAHAPWLKLYALLYGQDFSGRTAILARFRNSLDGVIYAFAGPRQPDHAPQNTTDPRGVSETTRRIRGLTRCEGAKDCWQFSVPLQAHGIPAAQEAQVRSRVTLPQGAHDMEFQVADDRGEVSTDSYTLNVAVAGASRPLQLGPKSEDGWRRATARVVVPSRGAYELAVSVTTPPTTRSVTVFVSDVRVDGASLPSDVVTGSSVSASATAGASVRVVSELELILMMYSARFSVEKAVPGAADRTYFERVLTQAVDLARSGTVDGLVAYRLNLTTDRQTLLVGDPANRPLLSQAYASLLGTG